MSMTIAEASAVARVLDLFQGDTARVDPESILEEVAFLHHRANGALHALPLLDEDKVAAAISALFDQASSSGATP